MLVVETIQEVLEIKTSSGQEHIKSSVQTNKQNNGTVYLEPTLGRRTFLCAYLHDLLVLAVGSAIGHDGMRTLYV